MIGNSVPRLAVWASGEAGWGKGGSGFEKLVEASRSSVLRADIVAVISNHQNGGVRERADRLGIPFVHLEGPFPTWDDPDQERAERLQREVDEQALQIAHDHRAEWHSFSGMLKRIRSLPAVRTTNIHPALTSQLGGRFAGPGMYGHHVHEAVAEALHRGELGQNPESGFTMHFVNSEYDKGPVFAEVRVSLRPGMDADEIQKLVNAAEHEHQAKLTDLVLRQWIVLRPDNSVTLPPKFKFEPRP